MGRLKKLLTLALSVAMLLAINASVLGAEINVNERKMLDAFKEEPFATYLDKKYINQFENYFSRDDVNVDKRTAELFIDYFSKGLVEYRNSRGNGPVFSQSSKSLQNFQYAGSTIDLYLEYDSKSNSFYAIDTTGYVVLDPNKIIKDTDSDQKSNKQSQGEEDKTWGISIEIIFAGVIFLIFVGFVFNAKKWMNKIRRHSDKNYDDEEEDEMEVANRKTRRARLQTFSYTNFKQVVKYFYVPIIMCIILIGTLIIIYRPYVNIYKSFKNGFVKNLTLNTYSEETKNFDNVPVIKESTIKGNQVHWPKYTEPYGVIRCEKIGLSVPMYMGDSDYVLSGAIKRKVENDYEDEFEGKLDEKFKGAAGTYLGSSIPGDGKTILVGAHDTTYFAPLEKAKKGMVMDVTTTYARYKYQVKDIKVFDEGDYDKAYNLQSDKETLILYTCYPFGKLNGDKSKRMFVYLDKTFGPSIDKEVAKK